MRGHSYRAARRSQVNLPDRHSITLLPKWDIRQRRGSHQASEAGFRLGTESLIVPFGKDRHRILPTDSDALRPHLRSPDQLAKTSLCLLKLPDAIPA